MPNERPEMNRPQRWDVPFWKEADAGPGVPEMTEAAVERLLTIPPFRELDPQKFSAHTPLRGILLNDTRKRRFGQGELVVRQGDYGNSAFFILAGSVRVILQPLDDVLLGRRKPQHKSFFSALAQLWNRPAYPEVRKYQTGPADHQSASGAYRSNAPAIFLQDVSAILQDRRTARLQAGEFFGEIAALGRTPRTSTIFADEETELLEIRWQGLREIRLRSSAWKEHIDRLYRERSLKTHLLETPAFSHLNETELEQVARATEFQTHGTFDWHTSYKKIAAMKPTERLQIEPIVAREGHYPNGVFLIRSGFGRVSEIYNHGERTLSYLGRGQVFGFEEVAHNWQRNESLPFQRTLRAVGYLDVLFVPTPIVEKYVLPSVPPPELPKATSGKSGAPLFHRQADVSDKPGPDMLEFLVENRFINGTATMIIDLDRCTRCDDCVRACAATHNSNPRFIRHGPNQSGFMIANACMHCLDPVCMIGCPTGAIHRESFKGQVVINDLTCIGCATCANSCPYDNIQMVYARDEGGNVFFDQETHQPIQKAAKCDLCVDQITGPACARACPHDALIRADMRDVDRLAAWFNK